MLSKKMEKALNEQVIMEGYASNYYLAAASFADVNGLPGIAKFLYGHADEERMHMMKIFHYINDCGGHAEAPALQQPPLKFGSVLELFEAILAHEGKVTKSINDLVDISLQEKDYGTNHFLQWFVMEQHEEETLFRGIIDKIKLLGNDPKANYYIDKELGGMRTEMAEE
jgi:ferritin